MYPLLYKYLRKEHAVNLSEKGQFRLGTLYEYRDVEKHGDVVGDNNEGKSTLAMTTSGETWTARNTPQFARNFFAPRPGANFSVEGITFVQPQQSIDYFLYCTSDRYDEQARNEFKCDACVVINDPEGFFSEISKFIRDKASYAGVAACVYTSRVQPHDAAVQSMLIKELKYESQHEVRAFWTPNEKDPQPIVVEIPALTRFCSPYPK